MIFPWMGNPDAEIRNYTTSKLRRASQEMVRIFTLMLSLLSICVTVQKAEFFQHVRRHSEALFNISGIVLNVKSKFKPSEKENNICSINP